MKRSISFLGVILIASFFAGCKKENMCDCFKRTGPIVRESRDLSGFDRIMVENNVNVFITQDSVFKVEIEAGDNIEALIKTEVVDGTLYCRNKNRCNWARSYKKPLNIYITMPVIKYITSDGTGNITSLNTITTPEFDVQTKKLRKHQSGCELFPRAYAYAWLR